MSRYLTPAQAAQAAAEGSVPALLTRAVQRVPGISRTHYWASRHDVQAYTYTLNDEDEDMIYDAVVIAGGTPGGKIYATVDAAIAAGAKSIFVKAGVHAGFTANVNGLLIVGEGVPYWDASAGFSADGPRFTSTITVSGKNISLEKLAVDTSSGAGFSVTGHHLRLTDCQACGCATHGLETTGTFPSGAFLIARACQFSNNAGSGILDGSGSNACRWYVDTLVGYNGDSGIRFTNHTTKEVMIIGCYLDANQGTNHGYGVANYGYGIDNHIQAHRIVVTGCIIIDNDSDSNHATIGTVYPAHIDTYEGCTVPVGNIDNHVLSA